MNIPPELSDLAKLVVPTAGAIVIFKQSLQKIAGAATDEVIGLFQDSAQDKRRWRQFQRQVNLLIKAQEFLTEKGLEPQNVPLKSLVPMLEGVKVEENESMQDKWAALLANAASGELDVAQLPSFSEILRLLSPTEAKLLDAIYEKQEWDHSATNVTTDFGFNNAYSVRVVTEGLIRQRLIRGEILHHPSLTKSSKPGVVRGILYEDSFVASWEPTTFGVAFVQICQPPRLATDIQPDTESQSHIR